MLDRLTSALANGVTRGYGYDAIGNRTASNVDAASTTYTYPGTSHRLQTLTGATTRSYAYDAAGDPTQIDAAVHGYNLANRLTSVSSTSSASYAINALGQQVAKTVDGVTTRTVYDEQGRLIGEYQADGTLIQETVWLDDLPVATLRPTGSGTPTPIAVYYVHADHLGSPRAITRPADDQIVWRWDNAEPFGANAANENPSGLGNFRYDLRFPGQQYDPETATHYNYFRDYDPTTGRYRQSDPIGLLGGLGSYQYADSNPIRYFDRLGLIIAAPTPPSIDRIRDALLRAIRDRVVCLKDGQECSDYHQAILNFCARLTALAFVCKAAADEFATECMVNPDAVRCPRQIACVSGDPPR